MDEQKNNDKAGAAVDFRSSLGSIKLKKGFKIISELFTNEKYIYYDA